MIHSCVNPDCRTEFEALNTGHLYVVERRSANTKLFWLYATCVARFILCLDLIGTSVVIMRANCKLRRSPHPKSYLLLVFGRIHRHIKSADDANWRFPEGYMDLQHRHET